MVRYSGPQIGDEKPQGGGKHNEDNLGHEAFNFRDFDGKLYGFIQPRIDLLKVDSAASRDVAKLDNVTIIFVAAYGGGQTVVGWYRDAVLYGEPKYYPSRVKEQINLHLKRSGWSKKVAATFNEFRAEAPTAKAVLLPEDVRISRPPIPRTKGGFGQHNACYLLKNGKRKDASWIKEVTSFVRAYKGKNLLQEGQDGPPPVEGGNSEKEAILAAQERKQGFESSPAIRKVIETHAMERARAELETRGYRDFNNTSSRKSYDYTCHRNGKQYYVEVKGTQTDGDVVILTKNEVAHANENPDTSIIVIVHGLKVTDGDPPTTDGGEVDVHEGWKLKPRDLTALQYQWRAPGSDDRRVVS
jgi:hypothetical protein